MEETAANTSSQDKIKDDQLNRKDSNPTLHNNEISSVQQETQFTCSLYISSAGSPQDQSHRSQVYIHVILSFGHLLDCELLRSHLEAAVAASKPLSAWRVSETPCGLIAAFVRENDAEKLLQRGNLAQVFGRPIQVARFSARDSRYRQAVLLRDVPWAIPLQDINSALTKQGIVAGNVERLRQFVRVEVKTVDYFPFIRLIIMQVE
ncbi:uncharacterized protein LOC113561858 [Ooceraea biroi]|uniref:uncharacterized protein LOC113561858 n=1 Tax=Ooceraea biroi TaxID=2015173 RepID=UPI000F09498C|nr:uncharacterized protein LOC113561858 [Ooceraea biroi]